MRIYLFCLVLLAGFYSANAQNETVNYIKPTTIKTNVFGVLDFSSTSLNLAVERRISNISSYQVQVGYIFLSSLAETSNNLARGYKLRPEIRFYTEKSKGTFFYAWDLSHKQYWFDKEAEVGFNCADEFGNCSYFQLTEYQIRRLIMASHFKVGFKGYFNTNNTGPAIEITLGGGLRYVRSFSENLPIGAQPMNWGTFDIIGDDGSILLPSIISELFFTF